jgi:hypothetical protein
VERAPVRPSYTKLTASYMGQVAEWIAERPQVGANLTPLARTGATANGVNDSFGGAYAKAPNLADFTALGSLDRDRINMTYCRLADSAHILETASTLDSTNRGFTTTYVRPGIAEAEATCYA